MIIAEDEDDVARSRLSQEQGIPQAKQHPKLEGDFTWLIQSGISFRGKSESVPHTLALP